MPSSLPSQCQPIASSSQVSPVDAEVATDTVVPHAGVGLSVGQLRDAAATDMLCFVGFMQSVVWVHGISHVAVDEEVCLFEVQGFQVRCGRTWTAMYDCML
jgi:hypothetical protein